LCGDLGDIKKGAATGIYFKLKDAVEIEYGDWAEGTTPKLKLYTLDRSKLYGDEMVLEECTVDEVVILFEFVAEEKKEDEEQEKVWCIL
jgi:hypothetical protein